MLQGFGAVSDPGLLDGIADDCAAVGLLEGGGHQPCPVPGQQTALDATVTRTCLSRAWAGHSSSGAATVTHEDVPTTADLVVRPQNATVVAPRPGDPDISAPGPAATHGGTQG